MNIERVYSAVKSAEHAQLEVDFLILRTPSGEKRNLYTEANILLLSALEKLKEAEKA